MPYYTLSPNMSLIVPTVSVAPGPDWAQYLNSSLSILDQHTHTSGSGVAITQDAISLSPAGAALDSLSFNNSNAISLRSGRFYAQSAALALATDIGCVYVAGVDLYYNDVNGNQIRITQSGSVAGSSGTITGLPSGTASASYSAGTFVFQAATSTAANIDGASYIFRNNTASSFGLTLSPPAAMAANYSLTLPALPVATSIMRLDTSGNISANLVVDNSTLEISSNTLQIKASGVGTTQIASGAVTKPKLAALGQQISSSCGNFVTTSTTPVAVTNLSVSITTTGRPVMLSLISAVTLTGAYIESSGNVADSKARFSFARGGAEISTMELETKAQGSSIVISRIPCSSMSHIDVVAAGTYTYTVLAYVVLGDQAVVNEAKLVAYEL